VYEVLHSHRTQGWRILESASVSYGKATPYFPVLDLLKRYCQIDEGDTARTIRARVTGQVLTLDETLQDTLPALLALLDVLPDDSPFVHLDPSQRRQRTLEALRRVLLRESQVQPLLLVFEDLHWIDTETQALLDRLIESLPTAPLLLLVNYRPEYQHAWGSKTYYTQVRLDPLPPASAEAFLTGLLGDDSSLAPLLPLLMARTAGNPFFLEESVRTLVETAVLVGTPGAYRLAALLQGLPVPATVQAVLAARIDRLAPQEKGLLQTAAVLGTDVPFALLRTIADVPEAALHRGLAHLQAAEFLYETRLFPEPEYTFKHALTHEVAYGSLLLERRRVLHARLVEAIEALAPARGTEVVSGAKGLSAGKQGPDRVERLAHHALRGEVWDKAAMYCQQAGVRASDRAAFREAVAAFEQALQALTYLPESDDTRALAIDLRLALGGSLNVLGEYGRCLALLGEAEALARGLDDRARLAQVLSWMALVRRITGDSDGAMAASRQALDLAVALGDRALQMEASHHLALAYWAFGDCGRAVEMLRRNVETAAEQSGTPSTDVRIRSQAFLAWCLGELGAFTEGRCHGEEALHLATLEGRGAIPFIVHASLSRLYLAQGDLEHAIRLCDQGLALSRASGNRNMLPIIVAGLGYASALQGRLAEGRALLEEAISESIHQGVRHTVHWVWLSEVCRLAGHGAEAWQHASQALDLARQRKARGDEAHALHQLGVVQAHTEPPDAAQAEAFYQQALALAEALGMRPLVAHCHQGLGTLYATTGQWEQARAELSTAIEMYRSMEMTFWLPQTDAVLAQVEARFPEIC
jgi:tetratricopeptide (TPR) repeat protein